MSTWPSKRQTSEKRLSMTMIDDSSTKAGQERKHPTSEEEISPEGEEEHSSSFYANTGRGTERIPSETARKWKDEENDDERKEEDALVDILAQ